MERTVCRMQPGSAAKPESRVPDTIGTPPR